MTNESQHVGERITYRQGIVDDTIVSAVWSCGAPGTDLTGQTTSATDTTIKFEATVAGVFILTCTITGQSGQVRISKFRITAY